MDPDNNQQLELFGAKMVIVLEGISGTRRAEIMAAARQKDPNAFCNPRFPLREWESKDELRNIWEGWALDREIRAILQLHRTARVEPWEAEKTLQCRTELQDRSIFSAYFVYSNLLFENGNINDDEIEGLDPFFEALVTTSNVHGILFVDIDPWEAVVRKGNNATLQREILQMRRLAQLHREVFTVGARAFKIPVKTVDGTRPIPELADALLCLEEEATRVVVQNSYPNLSREIQLAWTWKVDDTN